MKKSIVYASIFMAFQTYAQDTLRQCHANGQISMQYPMKGDKYHGLCQTWYANGQLKSSGKFNLGLFDSITNWWHEDGQLQMTSTYVDGFNTLTMMWSKNGQLIYYYKTTHRLTETKTWSDSGILLLHTWYKKGQPVSCTVVTALVSAQERDTPTVNTLPDHCPCTLGNKTVFVTRGIPYDSLGREVKNHFRGKELMWTVNGILLLESHYKRGKLSGRKREWDEQGKLIKDEIYRHGKLIRKLV